jgi:hypothetical protein
VNAHAEEKLDKSGTVGYFQATLGIEITIRFRTVNIAWSMIKHCSLRMIVCLLLLAASSARAQQKPKVMEWRQYPVPHGTPESPRPPDSAFLRLVPPIRKLGIVGDEAEKFGLAAWWADYGQFLFSEQPPTDQDFDRQGVIRTSAGEDEPVVLALWGLRVVGEVELSADNAMFPVNVRVVEFEPRHIPGDYHDYSIEAGRVVGIPTYLPERSSVEVRPGQNAAFWITVSVPPDAQPGTYKIPLRLLLSDTEQTLRMSITVEVLPFDLPRAKIAYGMYFRPSSLTLKNPRDRTPEMLRHYWRDMARHGMTSATLYNYTRLHDDTGKLKLDGVPALEWLQQMIEDRLVTVDVPVMFLDGGGIDLQNSRAQQILGAFKREAKARGWPELLYYGPDEPGVNDHSLDVFNQIQPVREHLRIVTAISDHAAATYADLLDVWIVNVGCTTPTIQQLAADKGVELWNYTCHNRGHGNAPFQRFYAGIYTWALGLKGNFIWAYTEDYTRENGQFLPWSPIYCYVVPSDEGLLPSIAWEARREGVEDYRLLVLLEERIAGNPDSQLAHQARQWLDSIRGRVDWYVARDMPPSLYPWDGPELYPLCPNFEPSEFSHIRAKAIDYILEI